ncbi:RmlC-like cupin domain-containing protein [Mycena alexandri]|uniref:RmlC-like cupin domain-containing protein n=1 Tax=Mycena alexandri TaxID=1745969 RepID=A0AAD6X4R8_9AGAR|nr:RmlC-like cupin domain-containing protein [Mycena alexandri]
MPVKIIPRRSHERGLTTIDWLRGFHTFSVASYRDPAHMEFGPLLVINEDRVAAYNGFGAHSHREFEIFSYIVSGQLEHKDSMGNTEILKRGDLQLTSTGTGIAHSEQAYGSEEVHFLQIWCRPSTPRLSPKYFTRHFTDDEKRDAWVRVVAPVDAEGVQKDVREGTGPAPVQSPLTLYATLLTDGKSVKQTMVGSKGFIQVVQTSGFNDKTATGATVKIISGSGVEAELSEGDGAYLYFTNGGELMVRNIGDKTAELLLFDLE